MKNFIKKITLSSVFLSVFLIPAFAHADVPVTLNYIEITTPADKLEYTVGDSLDITGLVVSGNYSWLEGEYNEEVSISESNITGFDSATPAASQTLTITFDGKTTTYDISIVAPPGPVLESISIRIPADKLEYTVGESLDIEGLIVCANYVDEEPCSEDLTITTDDISGFNSSTPTASQTLTITYDGKTTTYTISIVEEEEEEPTRRSGTIGGTSVSRASAASLSSGEGQVLGESTFAFNVDLRYGMRNEDVRQLQERLRAEGFFTFHTSTGYFGPITLAAVKAYQQAHFAEIGYVTGFVGPLTRAVLNK